MYELSPLRTEKYPIFIIAGLKHRYCSLSACYPKKTANKNGALGHIRARSSWDATQSV